MGTILVAAALNPAWAHLSAPARHTLIYMCHTAADTPADGQPWPHTYNAGAAPIAASWYGPTDNPTNQRRRTRRVSQWVKELVDAGALHRIKTGGGHPTRYLVTPWRSQPDTGHDGPTTADTPESLTNVAAYKGESENDLDWVTSVDPADTLFLSGREFMEWLRRNDRQAWGRDHPGRYSGCVLAIWRIGIQL